MLKLAVILTGIGSVIVLASPGLVILGLFLIVPGIVMVLLPTVFIYLALTLLIRTLLPWGDGPLAAILSLALALAIGWAVVQPWRMAGTAAYRAALKPDVLPADGVPFAGNVRIEWPELPPGRSTVACDGLCLALLDLPGVRSVTIDRGKDAATAFSLDGDGAPTDPKNPADILRAFERLKRERPDERGIVWVDTQSAPNFAAHWALRLAEGPGLVQRRAVSAEAADWTIRYAEAKRRDRKRVHVDRVEIANRQGDVVARSSFVMHSIPDRFFYIAFEGGSSADGFAGAHWHIGRQPLSSRRKYFEFDPNVEIIRLAHLVPPVVEGDARERLRAATVAALDDPSSTHRRLKLARLWLETYRYDLPVSEMPLLARILEDERISDPVAAVNEALGVKHGREPLRVGAARRFLASTDRKTAQSYAMILRELPEGTFAQPSADEMAIWSNPVSRQEGAPFLERMADRGPEAVEDLLRIVAFVNTKPWHARWPALRGVAAAFARLGPEGAAAIPTLRALIDRKDSPLVNSSNDREQWLVALARLGVPVEELPYGSWVKPERLPDEIANFRRRVEHYERELADRRRKAEGADAAD